jgi:hypothetical protein
MDELQQIPRGKQGSAQEALRQEYIAFRTLHRRLSAPLPPAAAFDQALFNIRRAAPTFEPKTGAAEMASTAPSFEPSGVGTAVL